MTKRSFTHYQHLPKHTYSFSPFHDSLSPKAAAKIGKSVRYSAYTTSNNKYEINIFIHLSIRSSVHINNSSNKRRNPISKSSTAKTNIIVLLSFSLTRNTIIVCK